MAIPAETGVDPNVNPLGGTNPLGPNPSDPGNPGMVQGGNIPIGPGNVIQTDQNTGSQGISLVVGGRPITIWLNQQLTPTATLAVERRKIPSQEAKALKGKQIAEDLSPDQGPGQANVIDALHQIESWYGNTTIRSQMVAEMYQAGLVTTKKPGADEVALAWSLLVQEAALPGHQGQTPQQLLAEATKSGWNALNPTLSVSDVDGRATGNPNNAVDSTTTSQTVYKSYLDPATIMGAAADSFYRLVGRNPTPAEYKGFLDMVYGYQNEENTGKFERSTTMPQNRIQNDPATGLPVDSTGTNDGSTIDPTKTTSIVSQRSIGTRGLEFLAGQAALASPDEANYQAATTYFNAFIKALQGPAAGMQSSGPTTTVP